MLLEIWSDLVCPWCYLGTVRLDKALAGFEGREDVDVVHRAFELNPQAPAGVTERTAEQLAHRQGVPVAKIEETMRHVEALAREDGLDYHLVDSVVGNTVDAHRIVHLGAFHGRREATVRALFHAYFEQGRSLFDHASLADVAAEVGLDREEAVRALAELRFAEDVADEMRTGFQLGVTGVPFFVADRKVAVAGAQQPDVLLQLLRRAASTD